MSKQGSSHSEERRSYWRTAIELHQQSGLSIRAFCQQEGLSAASFYAWRRRLSLPTEDSRDTVEAAPPAPFIPVTITQTASPLVIELASGATLRIGEGCSPALLRMTLETLGC